MDDRRIRVKGVDVLFQRTKTYQSLELFSLEQAAIHTLKAVPAAYQRGYIAGTLYYDREQVTDIMFIFATLNHDKSSLVEKMFHLLKLSVLTEQLKYSCRVSESTLHGKTGKFLKHLEQMHCRYSIAMRVDDNAWVINKDELCAVLEHRFETVDPDNIVYYQEEEISD